MYAWNAALAGSTYINSTLNRHGNSLAHVYCSFCPLVVLSLKNSTRGILLLAVHLGAEIEGDSVQG